TTRLLSCVSASRGNDDLASFPTRRSSDLGQKGIFTQLDPGNNAQFDTSDSGFLPDGIGIDAGHPVGGCTNPGALTAAQVALCVRSEEHTSELQSRENLVCRLLLEKKNYRL